jgi:hypothetical protein
LAGGRAASEAVNDAGFNISVAYGFGAIAEEHGVVPRFKMSGMWPGRTTQQGTPLPPREVRTCGHLPLPIGLSDGGSSVKSSFH